MSEGARIGILGGTFDPPHIGHLWLATLAADQLGLSSVLFMPAGEPPHKADRVVSPATRRTAMTERAIADDPLLELSRVDIDRPGPSYTVDSVAELRRQYGDHTHLVLLMAADSLAQIDTWREPDRILEFVDWAVAGRSGAGLPGAEAVRQRFGTRAERIHLVDGPVLEVSSSEIRERVAAGRTIRYLVPRAVEELIAERGLYRQAHHERRI